MTDPQFLTTVRIINVVAILFFFIPSIIAFVRKAKSKWLIFLLSILFMLPLFFIFSNFWFNFILYIARPVFWLAALIWAIAGKKEEKATNKNIGGENE